MDKQSQHSNQDLPNTVRVSDKIMQYYQQFGKERNLKKFMRLHSPVSSQDSRKTQDEEDCVFTLDSSCIPTRKGGYMAGSNSCEALAMKPLKTCDAATSKSLPNIDIQEGITSGKKYFSPKDMVVDINIQTEGEKEKIIRISAEDVKTPNKSLRNAKTQTPESVAKTHRRLEWDSLGDIGYKKSMSTSNISTIERSLLKEFFKENIVVSDPVPSTPARKEENVVIDNKKVQNLKTTDVQYSSPPLACSTLIATIKSDGKIKMISQSTSSTSLNEKVEKYAQTSLMQPPTLRSQEIQCTISSSNSVMEGTATPSSFEYHSSKSSKSKSSKLSDSLATTNSHNQFQPLDHPFITSITDLLMKRKCLAEKQQHHHIIHELQTKFQAALNENKENQSYSTGDSSTISSFSLSKQTPELDLGIQLICSLIDAKSINGRQKKQLIRDIIKRITCLDNENKTSNSSAVSSRKGTNTISSDSHNQHVYDSVRSNTDNKFKPENMINLIGTSNDIQQMNISDNSGDILDTKHTRNHLNSKHLNFPQFHHIQQYKNESCEQFPIQKHLNENLHREFRIKVSSEAPAVAAINKQSQNKQITMERNKNDNNQTPSKFKLSREALDAKSLKAAMENKRNRCTQTSITSSKSTSATTTPDLTTQKLIDSTNNGFNSAHSDTDQPTMREWLNPLTQSEIEYEEKKQAEMKKKAQQKLIKNARDDCGRSQQLNWIENEIKRLECLKHLLLKDDTITKSSNSAPSLEHSIHKNLNKDATETDKLYDTVYSDKSSALTKSAEHLVQEIEIILEESDEDVVNLKDNIKRTTNRKKETHILFEKDEDDLKQSKTKPKPKFRIVNEKINYHEEQLLNGRKSKRDSKQQQQREKIDTPSTNKSEESDSLKDLVQQRKREFMEAYKSKKQHHYEALKQQQKEDFKYLNIPQQILVKRPASATDSEHYSVPHTLPRKYSVPLKPLKLENKTKTYDTLPERVYSATSTAQEQNTNLNSQKVIYSTSANSNTTTTHSSSSMFCMSSDVSVPMGSQNTSSIPTTTHQYDDMMAAAPTNVVAVAVQTSDSITRSKPIYGPTNSLHFKTSTFTTTACIQVKPKGIAYVIEFDDNKITKSNPSSITDINSSNDVRKKSNAKFQQSITTQTTNNLDPLRTSEPLLTLQEHLEKRNPKFLQHSKERRVILNQLQSMRQERERQLREIIDNTSLSSLDRRLRYLPPPAIQKARILKTKDMKALTNKRFANLAEVVAKQEREIEEKKRRGNRLLRDVFNKRLQKRVRSGKISLNHSKTVV